MKKLKILVIIIAAIALTGYVVMSHIESSLDRLTELPIENIDLNNVPDGAYTGSYKVFPVAAEVRVTVKDHTITDIELIKHRNGQGGAAEVIPGMVVEEQTLLVDTISGATYSSKVILKAIENALKQAGMKS